MDIKVIQAEWQKDAAIDQLNLADSAASIPLLHSKYYEILVTERLVLSKMRRDLYRLRAEKLDFFLNPTKEKIALGWQLPGTGKFTKSDADTFLNGDMDISDLTMRVEFQEEKVEFLKSIIASINTRNFVIKNILEDRRFLAGG